MCCTEARSAASAQCTSSHGDGLWPEAKADLQSFPGFRLLNIANKDHKRDRCVYQSDGAELEHWTIDTDIQEMPASGLNHSLPRRTDGQRVRNENIQILEARAAVRQSYEEDRNEFIWLEKETAVFLG